MAKTTKQARILKAFFHGQSLNRFDAEPLGDHCLHSTVSDLINHHGIGIESHWERVPNNHSDTLTRVKRYWLPEPEKPKAERLLRCSGVL